MIRPLLAIETATAYASVALVDGAELLGEVTASGARPHSVRLLPSIERLLAQASLGLDDLGGFALSIGPGSFTGLRIGLATLKGLAFEDERPVAAVPTLAALALAAGDPTHPVVACLDARRGEVYAGGYVSGKGFEATALAEGVYSPRALAERMPRPCSLVGCRGEESVLEALHAGLGEGVHLQTPAMPRAFFVGLLGAEMLTRGLGARVSDVVPRYLRRAEAEAQRTGERFETFDTPPGLS